MKMLSVTVPCYNSQDYMRKCVDSLLKGGDQMEIIIVDDGSTDNTGAIADDYAAKFPDNVRVVHQPNGGHGEGINAGLKIATGKYFRVVDSDDWLDESALKSLLAAMNDAEAVGGADMFVTNYVYTHADGSKDNVIDYRREFRYGKATNWQQTRKFGLSNYLTLHSATFRTEVVRKSGVVLPKHVFYEDNYFVYCCLKHVDTLRYLDVDLYRYYIGRQGQSVQSDVFAQRYNQQIEMCLLTFARYNLADEIRLNKKRGKCLYHNCRMMFAIAVAGARLNGSNEAERNCEQMWAKAIECDGYYGKKLRYRTPIALQMFPGKSGRHFANFLYKCTRRIVKN